MMQYEELTHETMKSDELKLADIRGYVARCKKKFTNPFLSPDELDWLIFMAGKNIERGEDEK